MIGIGTVLVWVAEHRRTVVWAAAMAAGVVAALVAVHYLESRGADRALQKVEQQDRSAADAAVEARIKRTECTGPGSDPRNRWDQSSGLCILPSAR